MNQKEKCFVLLYIYDPQCYISNHGQFKVEHVTMNNAKMRITPLLQIKIFAFLHECNSSNYELNEFNKL